MSQGPRRGWVRTVLAGVGAILCAGVVGCTDVDKPKDTRGRQPGPGLPNTRRLSGEPGSGVGASGVGMNGNSPYNSQVGGGIQQTGGVGRTTSGTGFGSSNMPVMNSTTYGNSTIPPMGPINNTNTAYNQAAPAGGAQYGVNPAAGSGMGYTVPPGESGIYGSPAPGTNSAPLPPGGPPSGYGSR